MPGGGVALLRCLNSLGKLKMDNHDQQIGVSIIKKVLEEPIKQIVANAGLEGAVVIEKVKGSKESNYGFDANSEKYGDMLKEGIIDPTKVTRFALQNASSVASLLLTTQVMVTELPEEEKAKMPPMPGGGMEGMY